MKLLALFLPGNFRIDVFFMPLMAKSRLHIPYFLVNFASHNYQIFHLFFRSAEESGSTYTIANLLTDVSLHSSQKLKRSANGLSVDQTFETETDIDDHYEFGNDSDYDYDDDVSDEEIDNNMKKLVERDTLGDSGYVEGRQAVMSDHSYSRTPKRAKQARSDGKLGVSMEVQALLSLANEATRQLEVIHGQKSE